MNPTEISFPPRFEGPPGMVNGGFLAGTLARALAGPVTVTLARPVPVSRALAIVKDGARVALVDAELSLAVAEPAPSLDPEQPRSVTVDEARAATDRFPVEGHPFPRCFVCGPDRDAKDAMRLLTGRTADGRAVAAPWVPSAELCHAVAGQSVTDVPLELVWAALDCPGGWSIFLAPGIVLRPMVLGRITGHVWKRPRVAETHVVVGTFAGQERRKHFCQSAIYDASGRLCAAAKSTWIALE